MQQIPLIHEDFLTALTTCVQALGGMKKAGVMLRPEYDEDPEKAARWLLACLNGKRDEKLSFEQAFKIMRAAKQIGCHSAMFFITQEVGYSEPQPIEVDDEKARLQRDYISAVNALKTISSRMEALA